MLKAKIKNLNISILSDNWYTLRKANFDYQKKDGTWEHQEREAYDRGNGAAIMLYNQPKGTVILTRQFRLPTLLNGNPNGMMIEACAGLLDTNDPAACIKRETEEETGYRISEVQKVYEAYMSPGSVTEILHFFIAEYLPSMKVNDGGGLESEQEEIEVMELPFLEVYAMMNSGAIKDAKTIMLLQHLKIEGIF
ncbi:UNVERIFIED_CONTAM: hypothetical protein GTU68_016416 [Idotea baltica]|nr:hypothetical protein [Idotea baltica]